MSNIDNIIADIENVNQTYDFWIRDENGNLLTMYHGTV